MNEFRISSAAVLKNVADGDGKIVQGGGWFQAHRIMLSLAALLGIVGFILIFVDHRVSKKSNSIPGTFSLIIFHRVLFKIQTIQHMQSWASLSQRFQ